MPKNLEYDYTQPLPGGNWTDLRTRQVLSLSNKQLTACKSTATNLLKERSLWTVNFQTDKDSLNDASDALREAHPDIFNDQEIPETYRSACSKALIKNIKANRKSPHVKAESQQPSPAPEPTHTDSATLTSSAPFTSSATTSTRIGYRSQPQYDSDYPIEIHSSATPYYLSLASLSVDNSNDDLPVQKEQDLEIRHAKFDRLMKSLITDGIKFINDDISLWWTGGNGRTYRITSSRSLKDAIRNLKLQRLSFFPFFLSADGNLLSAPSSKYS